MVLTYTHIELYIKMSVTQKCQQRMPLTIYIYICTDYRYMLIINRTAAMSNAG